MVEMMVDIFPLIFLLLTSYFSLSFDFSPSLFFFFFFFVFFFCFVFFIVNRFKKNKDMEKFLDFEESM